MALRAVAGEPANLDELLAMIRRAQDAKFGDYQANCAMPLAKTLKKPPRDVAAEIVARLDVADLCDPPEIAGPGFINLRLKDDRLAAESTRLANDPRLGVAPVAAPRKFIVDFSAPNIVIRKVSSGNALPPFFGGLVALMTQALALNGRERVLEIGTGSGYQAAILAALVREVITIERIPALSAQALERFDTLGIHNIVSIVGDGSNGWPPGAPFDAIMVTAGARAEPVELLRQLSPEHGRMVIPIGPSDGERLTLFRMVNGELIRQDLGSVRFVPLIRDHTREQDS